ncbi:uncharacterized protein LOC131936595 [Physella acuta]|uniref:uncharacterized protein LOC131936595 n=1 Tax=Physella acuta TaxID=109671 RepID=UPI0027DBC4D6|nr:uncharacterized protein LOC131936595 [Physella acuta]
MTDPFSDNVNVRVIGLSFAVAEALKGNVSNETVEVMGVISAGYILLHAAYRGFRSRHGNITMSTMFDSLIFDGLATALIPTVITRYVSRITRSMLRDISGTPDQMRTWGPTVTALFALLLTYQRIDIEVANFMNETVRKLY